MSSLDNIMSLEMIGSGSLPTSKEIHHTNTEFATTISSKRALGYLAAAITIGWVISCAVSLACGGVKCCFIALVVYGILRHTDLISKEKKEQIDEMIYDSGCYIADATGIHSLYSYGKESVAACKKYYEEKKNNLNDLRESLLEQAKELQSTLFNNSTDSAEDDNDAIRL